MPLSAQPDAEPSPSTPSTTPSASGASEEKEKLPTVVRFRDTSHRQVVLELFSDGVLSCSVGGELKVPDIQSLSSEGFSLYPDGKRWFVRPTVLSLLPAQEDAIHRALDLFRQSFAGQDLAASGLLLNVALLSARLTPETAKLGKLYCSCQLVGRKAKPVTTRKVAPEGPERTITWRHRAFIGGYTTGDSLLFVVKRSSGQVVGTAEMQLEKAGMPRYEGELSLLPPGSGRRSGSGAGGSFASAAAVVLTVEVNTGTIRERKEQRVLEHLEDAVRRNSAGSLEESFQEAVALGLPGDTYAEALQLLRQHWRAESRLVLKQGVSERRPSLVNKGVQLARLAGIDESEYRSIVDRFYSGEIASNMLAKALEKRTPEALTEALEFAARAGLPESDLVEAIVLLQLVEAIDSGTVPQLQEAIEAAAAAKQSPPECTRARRMMREKQANAARELISEGKATRDLETLRKAIRAAHAANLAEVEYAETTEILKDEERKEQLRPVLSSLQTLAQTAKRLDMDDFEALVDMEAKLARLLQAGRHLGGSSEELEEAEGLRKRIHNKACDLRGCIRVFCRVRPLSQQEEERGDYSIAQELDPMTIQVDSVRTDFTGHAKRTPHTFNFDAVFMPGTQDEIFTDCRELVKSALEGHNVTLLAYGQTGAGKTYTMCGSGEPGTEGISQRTITELFSLIELGKIQFDYSVRASVVELYLTEAYDLLAESREPLHMRYDGGGYMLENLTETSCSSASDLRKVFQRGQAQRAHSETSMNLDSSRSHLILTILVSGTHRESGQQVASKIVLVDLAGSERLKKSRSTGLHEREAIEINKSLAALGDVIYAVTQEQTVVPYRNHKLTQILQDSLGGTAKALMFVNCSPAASNCDETIMSLNFAVRAKTITNELKRQLLRLVSRHRTSLGVDTEEAPGTSVLALDLSEPREQPKRPVPGGRRKQRRPMSRGSNPLSPPTSASASSPATPPSTALTSMSPEALLEELARERAWRQRLEVENAKLRQALEEQQGPPLTPTSSILAGQRGEGKREVRNVRWAKEYDAREFLVRLPEDDFEEVADPVGHDGFTDGFATMEKRHSDEAEDEGSGEGEQSGDSD